MENTGSNTQITLDKEVIFAKILECGAEAQSGYWQLDAIQQKLGSNYQDDKSGWHTIKMVYDKMIDWGLIKKANDIGINFTITPYGMDAFEENQSYQKTKDSFKMKNQQQIINAQNINGPVVNEMQGNINLTYNAVHEAFRERLKPEQYEKIESLSKSKDSKGLADYLVTFGAEFSAILSAHLLIGTGWFHK